MNLTYRAGRADDVPHLHRMLLGLAATEGADHRGSEAALLAHGFGARPLFHTVIAATDHTPHGMALYYPDFSTVRGQPGVYVQDLFVEPEARGTGVAQGLLAHVMRDAAESWAACYLTLGVSPSNTRAVRFYERLGFRKRPYDFLILEGDALQALTAA